MIASYPDKSALLGGQVLSCLKLMYSFSPPSRATTIPRPVQSLAPCWTSSDSTFLLSQRP
jgi:hypothetical protein